LAHSRRSSSSLFPRLLCAFFQGKCCAYPFGKKEGAVEYSFCKMDTPSVPKYLHPLTFTKTHLTIHLIQKICENVKNNYDILQIYIMIKHVVVNK
jgi:hypothetical protein